MLSRRLWITIFLIFCLVGIGGYSLLSLRTSSHWEESFFSHFQKGDLVEAEAVLVRAALPEDSPELLLCEAYLQHARGNIVESDRTLSLLASEVKGDSSRRFPLLLLQATNAWIRGDSSLAKERVEAAAPLCPDHPLVAFFRGLFAYHEEAYAAALHSWRSIPYEKYALAPLAHPSSEGSGRELEGILAYAFPPLRHQLRAAHCALEEGDFLVARRQVEKAGAQGEEAFLASLLLGLTYLREAEVVPSGARINCYKLACFYFERAGSRESFPTERARAAFYLSRAVEGLLSTPAEREAQEVTVVMLQLLGMWREEERIEALADRYAEWLLEGSSLEFLDRSRPLREVLWGSNFHLLVLEKVVAALTTRLSHPCVPLDPLFYERVVTLSPTPGRHFSALSAALSVALVQNLPKEEVSLSRTDQFLSLWKRIPHPLQEEERLAELLFFQGKLYWQQVHQEEKGRRLMEYALALSPQKEKMERRIATFLTELYHQARGSNLIDRLLPLLEAMEAFHMVRYEVVTPIQLANHLADADYLYHTQQYALAKAHAIWVLHLSPGNTHAQRLLGMSAFHLGEYGCAIGALEALEAQEDEEVVTMLMISHSLYDQAQHFAHHLPLQEVSE